MDVYFGSCLYRMGGEGAHIAMGTHRLAYGEAATRLTTAFAFFVTTGSLPYVPRKTSLLPSYHYDAEPPRS